MRNSAPVTISDADRAALARLARRGRDDRVALRARGVLMLAGGTPKATAARTLRVGVATVRAWEARWRAGGVEALRSESGRIRARGAEDPFAALSPALPSAEAEALRADKAGRRGRPASARPAVEALVRDAAALGVLAPGDRLPERAWFAKRLHASKIAVDAAFSALARQGFVRSRARVGSFLASRLPFENRYLAFLSLRRDGSPRAGLDAAIIAAIRAREGEGRAKWEVVGDVTYTPQERLRSLLAACAAQRFAGVFFRYPPAKETLPGHVIRLDRVPVSGLIGNLPWHGAFANGLSAATVSPAAETVFAAIRAAGFRRTLVLDQLPVGGKDTPDVGREAETRAKAAGYGLDVPPAGYILLCTDRPEQTRIMLRIFAAAAKDDPPEAVAVLQDNFAPDLCDALVEAFGEKTARGIAVFAFGNAPALPETRLPVTWHGLDLAATLDSFTDWCDAIHAGAKAPPLPLLATF